RGGPEVRVRLAPVRVGLSYKFLELGEFLANRPQLAIDRPLMVIDSKPTRRELCRNESEKAQPQKHQGTGYHFALGSYRPEVAIPNGGRGDKGQVHSVHKVLDCIVVALLDERKALGRTQPEQKCCRPHDP